jgi:hypothetical protein
MAGKRKVLFEKGTKYVSLPSIQHDYNVSVKAARKCVVQRSRREGKWIDMSDYVRPTRLVSGIYSWSNSK